MTNHESKIIDRLIMALASESGESFSDIASSIEDLEFRDAKELLQDEILNWQARNQYADDYDNGLIL